MTKGSNSYDYIERGAISALDDLSPEKLGRHVGSLRDYELRSQKVAANAVRGGPKGLRELAPHLLAQIADPRTLRLAWEHLRQRGGHAPGLDGKRVTDYSRADVWAMAKALGQAMRSGTYRPDKEKIYHIEKASGGTRPIVVLNVGDRMVQRASTMALQPLLDPFFHTNSFGFRPKLGHLRALAAAEATALAQRRFVWLTADIKDAFQHVPIPRLLNVLRRWFPDPDLMDFLVVMLPGKFLKGLRQGGAFSPLALNVYLHHFLDWRWYGNPANPPLFQFADDILMLCRDMAEARAAYAELRRLLDPAGMPLKHAADESISDLATGACARWMGFAIFKAKRGFRYELTPRAWGSLDARIGLAHSRPDAPLRALLTAKAWLSQRGPAYHGNGRRKSLCRRVLDVARAHGFEEMPTVTEMLTHWQAANARWHQLRNAAPTANGSQGNGTVSSAPTVTSDLLSEDVAANDSPSS